MCFQSKEQHAKQLGIAANSDTELARHSISISTDSPTIRTGKDAIASQFSQGRLITCPSDNNLNQIEARHEDGIGFFKTWSEVAPAFGMIGTLLGLIGMMANLEDTASVGPNMAVALVTTLYGSIFANLVLIPLKSKLQVRHKDEMTVKEIMVQGILSIQSGDNPRILEDKLYTFMAPAERPVRTGPGEG